jgi:hypothetical protein
MSFRIKQHLSQNKRRREREKDAKKQSRESQYVILHIWRYFVLDNANNTKAVSHTLTLRKSFNRIKWRKDQYFAMLGSKIAPNYLKVVKFPFQD